MKRKKYLPINVLIKEDPTNLLNPKEVRIEITIYDMHHKLYLPHFEGYRVYLIINCPQDIALKIDVEGLYTFIRERGATLDSAIAIFIIKEKNSG
jgi:hypothetical protein